MYHDEETDFYFRSRHDFEVVELLSKIKRGELRRIDGFSRYTITEEGIVYNVQRVRPVTPTTNGHRLAIQLTSDDGRRVGFGLARLVALHFIPMPQDGQYYDAVHVDGNFENVRPDNLEWVPRWKRHVNQSNYGVNIH